MTVVPRLLGAILGAVAGYLLTIVPCLWENYQATHRADPQILLVWTQHYTPAAVLPTLVGLFVGQSLVARMRRKIVME